MEAVVKARIREVTHENWELVLSANNNQKTEFLRMFLNCVCPHWTNPLILSPASTHTTGNKLALTFNISPGPDPGAEAKWEFLMISLTDLADEMARQGMQPDQASRRATEDFPKTVQKYLDEGWEILTGDSNLVYLKKNHPRQEYAQLMPLIEYLNHRDTFIMTEVYAELASLKDTAQLAGISDEDLDSKLRKAFSDASVEWHATQSEMHKHQVEMSRV